MESIWLFTDNVYVKYIKIREVVNNIIIILGIWTQKLSITKRLMTNFCGFRHCASNALTKANCEKLLYSERKT